MGVLESLGPWITDVGLVALLWVALARGWLYTSVAVKVLTESQESRVVVAEQRENEWKQTAKEAIKVIELQGKQIEASVEIGETVLKIVEAFPRSSKDSGTNV